MHLDSLLGTGNWSRRRAMFAAVFGAMFVFGLVLLAFVGDRPQRLLLGALVAFNGVVLAVLVLGPRFVPGWSTE